MQQVIYLLLVVVAYSQPNLSQLPSQVPDSVRLRFDEFKTKYSKNYKSPEENFYRTLVFRNNKVKINAHNNKADRTYNMGDNQFLDLTEDQFGAYYLGLLPRDREIEQYVDENQQLDKLNKDDCGCREGNQEKKMELEEKIATKRNRIEEKIDARKELIEMKKERQGKKIESVRPFLTTVNPQNVDIQTYVEDPIEILFPEQATLPQNNGNSQRGNSRGRLLQGNLPDVDWTSYAGDVRHQQRCGACYAFATVNNVEALYAKNVFYGIHLEFSTQQIIDCVFAGYDGCSGGMLSWSYNYIKLNGVVSYFMYPYNSGINGVFSGSCQFNSGMNPKFLIKTWKEINNSCSSLRTELQNVPVSTAISGLNLQFYSTGVFSCSRNPILDHAVLIVGYQATKGWKIKNSWGTTWGENGYGWITPNQNNNCGICIEAALPVL